MLSTLYFETVQGQNALHGFVNHLQLNFLHEK